MAKKAVQQQPKDGVLITTLTLRDGLQSTGVWKDFLPLVQRAIAERNHAIANGNGKAAEDGPEVTELRKVAQLMVATGYTGAEVFWGQSFQKHMIEEISPYEAIEINRVAFGDDFLLSGLGRGVNAVGFRPYGPDVISSLVTRFAERGGAPGKKLLKMRIFDALNSQDNCSSMVSAAARHNASAGKNGKLIHIEAALCYQPEREINVWGPDGSSIARKQLFTDDYYVAYAKKQIATAEAAGSTLDSLVIKDMAGQLNAERTRSLLPKLKSLGVPVYLHLHAMNYKPTVETMRTAAELGITGVEVADWPLAAGTSHASVRDVLPGMEDVFIPIDLDKLTELEDALSVYFGKRDELMAQEGTPGAHRDDLKLNEQERLILWGLGIPGGAMPAVMDLLIKTCKLSKITQEQAVDRFQEELERLQGEIGWVPLVTPMADIVYTQAIINMQNGRYTVVEDRFAKMILGHYGRYVNHADDTEIEFAPSVVQAVSAYCAGVKEGTKLALGGKAYPPPDVLTKAKVYAPEMDATREKLTPLLQRAGVDPASPVADEVLVTKLMEPPASTNLTERILFGPQQARIKGLIEKADDVAGEPDQPFASDLAAELYDAYAGDKRANKVVDELVSQAPDPNFPAVLDQEVTHAAASLPSADREVLRREVARLLSATLQTRFIENHIIMAREAKDIPFEPLLAIYFDRGPGNGSSLFAGKAVQDQVAARLQIAFHAWYQDPSSVDPKKSAYNNWMLHAALSGDGRMLGLVPPPAAPPYLDA